MVKGGYCLRYLRIDKGGETVLFTAAHYDLFLKALTLEGSNIEADGNNIAVPNCCCIWGSSPRNVRVERVWFQLRHTVTIRWGNLFATIEKVGLYRPTSAADCVVMQFVFMPLLRHKLQQFVRDKNAHPIRRQAH